MTYVKEQPSERESSLLFLIIIADRRNYDQHRKLKMAE